MWEANTVPRRKLSRSRKRYGRSDLRKNWRIWLTFDRFRFVYCFASPAPGTTRPVKIVCCTLLANERGEEKVPANLSILYAQQDRDLVVPSRKAPEAPAAGKKRIFFLLACDWSHRRHSSCRTKYTSFHSQWPFCEVCTKRFTLRVH